MKKSRKTPARKRPIKRARSSVRANTPTKTVATPGLTSIAIPRIGEYWPGEGGIFHGLMLGQDGKPDYALISAEKKHHHAGTGFAEMQEYPKSLAIDGHKDFAMPTRKEQRVQLANAKPGQFEDVYYWSGEQYATGSVFAWCQDFAYGYQNYWHKDGRCRGCAVRRVPIR